MSASITISVIVPAYNEEKLIARCLTSLKKQDFQLPFEIIVINNNSQDQTESIAKSFGVTVISEPMQSVVCARNRGLNEAVGEIVVGADCDCIYSSNWLTKIYANFQKDKNIVAVGGPGIMEKNPLWAYYIYKFGFGFVNFIYKTTGFVYYLTGFNFAYKKEVFKKLGGYHTYLDFGGDEWDPLQRLKKVGKVVYDHNLKVITNGRRYRVGFWKFWLVHTLYYYNLNYLLATIFKKPIIRAKPVRDI